MKFIYCSKKSKKYINKEEESIFLDLYYEYQLKYDNEKAKQKAYKKILKRRKDIILENIESIY